MHSDIYTVVAKPVEYTWVTVIWSMVHWFLNTCRSYLCICKLKLRSHVLLRSPLDNLLVSTRAMNLFGISVITCIFIRDWSILSGKEHIVHRLSIFF